MEMGKVINVPINCCVCGSEFDPINARQKTCRPPKPCARIHRNQVRKKLRTSTPKRGYKKFHCEAINRDPDPIRWAARVKGMEGHYAAVDSVVSRKLMVDPWFVGHLPCNLVDYALADKRLTKKMIRRVETAQNSTLTVWGYTVARGRRRIISKVRKRQNPPA
jgi:hypothetical protein